MKKFLIVLLAAFTAYQASGQDTFGVVYSESKLSAFEKMLLEIVDVGYMRADFVGNVKDKRIFIDQIVCRDGKFSTTALIDYTITGESSMQMFAKPISQDSITVNVAFNGIRTGNMGLALRNKDFIGMETGVAALMKDVPNPAQDTVYYPIGVDIPVMAYTTGIKVEIKVEDIEISGFDTCKLRDAEVHPREWYEKFGIKNYVYYTVRFE